MRLILAVFTALFLAVQATGSTAQDAPMQALLQQHAETIVKSSRRTIGPAIDAIAASGLEQAQRVLQKWQARAMWQRDSDGLFFWAEEVDRDTLRIFDFDSGDDLGTVPDDDFSQIKPNSGIRALLGVALVQFQLSDPNPQRRLDALQAIQRNAEASHLQPLRNSIETETDAGIRATKERLETLLTISFDEDEAARIAAIGDIAGNISLDARSTLNPLLAVSPQVSEGEVPADRN
ncbi:MAG: urea ABC transporter permease subunit UrtB, partial [Pseudomonadota bacterium]|nr:urea ABC transporter permease subunit UrtB [Pseudomonadota bacterium]